MNATADYVFAAMSASTVIDTLLAVYGRDFGEAGVLIESAGLAFLYRNGVDVGAFEIARLPVELQLRVLTSPDLWTRSEAERVRLVCTTLRACRARFLQSNMQLADADKEKIGLANLMLTGRTCGFSGSAARTALAAASVFRLAASNDAAATRRPGASGALAASSTAPLSTPPSQPRTGASGAGAEPQSEPPAVMRTAYELSSASGFSVTGGPSFTRPVRMGPIPSPASAAALSDVHIGDGALSPGPLRGINDTAEEELEEELTARTRARSSFSSLLLSAVELLWNNTPEAEAINSSSGSGAGADVARWGAPSPSYDALLSPHGAEESPGGDELGSLRELEAAFAPAWDECRLIHLTPREHNEAVLTGEVPPAALGLALEARERASRRLALANFLNVRRLSELTNLPLTTSICSNEDLIAWPAVRFGLEVAGVWEAPMTPLNENDPRSVSTERVYALGSAWSLDVKRYIAPTQLPDNETVASSSGGEYLAVYLRRRPLPPLGSPDGAEPDTRDRTTVAFSIRLCGAPGAPTSNSVCGRSTMGKPFGTEAESSWGWEAYLLVSSISERHSWTTGGALRFLISLDLV